MSASPSPPPSSSALEALLQRRQQLTDELRQIERSIYDLEESYLDDTNGYGNVYRGWDGFVSTRINKPTAATIGRKNKIPARERLFSLSSVTSPVNTYTTDGSANADANFLAPNYAAATSTGSLSGAGLDDF